MAEPLLKRLPDFYHDVKEMVLLMETQDGEKEKLLAAMTKAVRRSIRHDSKRGCDY